MVCPYVYQYEDTSSRCIFYNLSPSIHILFRKTTLRVGCVRQYEKKIIPNVLCVLYHVYLLLFKITNSMKAGMTTSIRSSREKIMGGQTGKVNRISKQIFGDQRIKEEENLQ